MARRLDLKSNWFDRALAVVAPRRALRSVVDRAVYSATTTAGTYRAGSKTRRPTENWRPSGTSPNAAYLDQREVIVARSRDLVRNAPLAAGAVDTVVTNVVGAGLTVKPKVDGELLGLSPERTRAWEAQAESIWREWAESAECDAGRRLTFADLHALMLRSEKESGDVFVVRRFIERPGSEFGTKLQLVEGDRVGNPGNKRDTATLAAGVELGAGGAPLAYHVCRTHPGETAWRGNLEYERIDAFDAAGERQVLHLFRTLRPDQARGVPWLAPVIEKFKQLADYSDAELQAALIAAMFTVFVKTETGEALAPSTTSDEVGGTTSDTAYRMAPGAVAYLAKGESIETADPGRPNSEFPNFVLAVVREMGVGLGLPYEVLIKHFTASYSASRAALLEAWRFYKNQRAWLARNGCQPVFEWVMAEAVARRRLLAPGFLQSARVRRAYLGATQWVGPGMTQIDPLKEVEAYGKAVDRGFLTNEQATAELNGGDWEDNAEQLGDERALWQRHGLAAPPQGERRSPPPDSGDDRSDDTEDEKDEERRRA